MTVTLDLEPDLEARLAAKAKADGVPMKECLQSLVAAALKPLSVEEAIALYEAQSVSQGQAAALAGLSRAEFIDALGRAGVSPFQYTADEILQEAFRE